MVYANVLFYCISIMLGQTFIAIFSTTNIVPSTIDRLLYVCVVHVVAKYRNKRDAPPATTACRAGLPAELTARDPVVTHC